MGQTDFANEIGTILESVHCLQCKRDCNHVCAEHQPHESVLSDQFLGGLVQFGIVFDGSFGEDEAHQCGQGRDHNHCHSEVEILSESGEQLDAPRLDGSQLVLERIAIERVVPIHELQIGQGCEAGVELGERDQREETDLHDGHHFDSDHLPRNDANHAKYE